MGTKMARLKTVAKPEPLKLDFGCGKNKQAGFHGVDAIKFDGVDTVLDVRKTPWPWADGSVDEVYSSHFLEHLTWPEIVVFFNELYRVMKLEATARIITPHMSNDCYYGDPTHKTALSAWYRLYLFKPWRDANAPHVGYTCNFDSVDGVGWDQSVMARNEEYRMYAAAHLRNAIRDLHIVLTKKPMP